MLNSQHRNYWYNNTFIYPNKVCFHFKKKWADSGGRATPGKLQKASKGGGVLLVITIIYVIIIRGAMASTHMPTLSSVWMATVAFFL